MAEYYVQTKQLSVGYQGQALIKDININVQKGEIVTLIGPNGAGKSTILKSITRQLALISGRVIFAEKDIQKYSFKELSARMAVVLTERMKPELMTCHDVVATGRYPYTGRLGILSREDEEIVDAAMRSVHAYELGNKDFNAISDGQRQRVLLARAICQEPDMIILDEPTSFLDVRHKLELLSILRDMAKSRNITVIMSLHEIDLAMKISDRIICVKGDHIFRHGKPEEIFEEGMIRDLYEIDKGYFDPLFGSIELPKPVGEAKVMVLSSCGNGIGTYRKLQKLGIPFSAGILYTNDVDHKLARLLAADMIEMQPFEPVSEEAMKAAREKMNFCSMVIDAGLVTGQGNACMRKLLEEAAAAGKLMTEKEFFDTKMSEFVSVK
ncbi:MAG: ABC transporter ATP-binding protein [Eubacteriales bacterium]|nr:ABC transporter ATP-binding protein [Eubacteriales bacterium]